MDPLEIQLCADNSQGKKQTKEKRGICYIINCLAFSDEEQEVNEA